MRRKQPEYWMDLVGGVTGRYKTEQIHRLLAGKTLPTGSVVVDVGAVLAAAGVRHTEHERIQRLLRLPQRGGLGGTPPAVAIRSTHRARGTAKIGQDPMQRARQVPEVHLLTQHRAQPARVRQRAHQQVGGLTPRRVG